MALHYSTSYANGTWSQWGFSGATSWQSVETTDPQPTHDEDTTRIITSTLWQYTSVYMTIPAYSAVSQYKGWGRGKKNANNAGFQFGVYASAALRIQHNASFGAFSYLNQALVTWNSPTEAYIDQGNTELMFRKTSHNGEFIIVTSMWAEMTYTPAAGGGFMFLLGGIAVASIGLFLFQADFDRWADHVSRGRLVLSVEEREDAWRQYKDFPHRKQFDLASTTPHTKTSGTPIGGGFNGN